MITHTLKEIVKDNKANITHVCEGKVYYEIQVLNTAYERDNSIYQLEINSNSDEWKATNMFADEKAITLMRWIRKGLKDGTFVQVK